MPLLSRARALITKVEKAKKTPAISPQPNAEKSFNANIKTTPHHSAFHPLDYNELPCGTP
jgi:hypothetical protein